MCVPQGQPITFAIPFHTGIAYLPRALESVLAQSDDNWRAYVVDNASPEPGVEELVKRVSDGRIRYLRNEKNLGMSGNFNRCIDLADTDLVTLLHADDELVPTYCAMFRDAAERYPRAATFFCRAQIIGPDGQNWFSLADKVKDFITPSTKDELVLEGEPGLRAVLKTNFIVAPTMCFRKSVLGDRRFAGSYKFVLDWELTTSLLLEGEQLVGLPQRCYRYRRHDNNTTETLTRNQQRFREESAFYNRMREEVANRGWDECVRLATQKRIIKLNLAYRTLKSAALLQFGEAGRGLKLLRDLYYNRS